MEEDAPDAKAIAKRISRLAAVRNQELKRRRSAAEELSDICRETPDLAKSAVPALVQCLCDPDDKVGESGLWGLHYCAPESIEPLIECLAHREAKVRERASHSLGNIGDEAISARDSLRKLLGDPVQEVRTRAMWPPAKTAVSALRSALEDEDGEFRAAAQEAMDAIAGRKH